jgi:hypothetical protein
MKFVSLAGLFSFSVQKMAQKRNSSFFEKTILKFFEFFKIEKVISEQTLNSS